MLQIDVKNTHHGVRRTQISYVPVQVYTHGRLASAAIVVACTPLLRCPEKRRALLRINYEHLRHRFKLSWCSVYRVPAAWHSIHQYFYLGNEVQVRKY